MPRKTELQAIAGTSSKDRAADIVFVHGLDGDVRLTWQQAEDYDESFWPQLLFNDVPTCGVWSFGYDGRSSEWIHGGTMPIVDRATNFAAFLRGEGIGEKPIFFIVHSLGGLIVKQVLRSRFDRDQDDPLIKQTKGIFFFATPHGGSDVSKLIQLLRFYRPTVLVKELESAASQLRDLNAWYQQNSRRLGIQTTVFAETKKTQGALIVDQLSSDPGIPEAEVIPVDADHIEICKIDTESMPYKTVRNAIEGFVRENAKKVELARASPLWMHVSCFNKYPDQWEEKTIAKPESCILKYQAVAGPNVIEVRPQLPYLDLVRAARPVRSIPYMWQPFRWLPLNLDLKFLNQSSETLYLTSLSIHVKKSRANVEPVLFVPASGAFPSLSIGNDGWGTIRRPTLRLKFEDGIGEPSFPDEMTMTVPVDDFTDFTAFDLSEQFQGLGVDVDAVMNRRADADLGPFKSRIAFIYGLLEFIGDDDRPLAFRFITDMRIEGPMYGMYGPPTFEYRTRLRVDGENYQQAVDISQVVKAGESDRFLLQLDVDRSSSHELEIEVVGNRGTLATSAPMNISLFVPRSVQQRVTAG